MVDLFPDSMLHAVSLREEDAGLARATQTAQRIHARRAKSELHLAEILPVRIAPGESWHVVSHGDVDAMSYLSHVLRGTTHFDHVAISTWCMSRIDVEQLSAWIDTGHIDQLDMYLGEIFPSQYGDEFELVKDLAEAYGCRVVVTRNHSKVMLMANREESYYLVSESSANVNTNPRIEQTALHASRELYEFYAEFFAGLKTIIRKGHV